MITAQALNESWSLIASRSNAAGVDGVTVVDFNKRARSSVKALAKEIAAGAYRSSPARYVCIPKADGDLRRIAVLCVRDRIVHHAVCQTIRAHLEPAISDVCHAYRHGRGVNSAISCVRKSTDSGYEWAVCGDIANYFDNIETARLLTATDALLPMSLASLVRACIEPLAVNGVGIPQGSAIAPILSNLYLDTFDADASKLAPAVRYSDNFVWMAKTKEEAERLLIQASTMLAGFALKLNPKSSVMQARGMTFLGETV